MAFEPYFVNSKKNEHREYMITSDIDFSKERCVLLNRKIAI